MVAKFKVTFGDATQEVQSMGEAFENLKQAMAEKISVAASPAVPLDSLVAFHKGGTITGKFKPDIKYGDQDIIGKMAEALLEDIDEGEAYEPPDELLKQESAIWQKPE